MNIQVSISLLISIAYFLTLFLFNLTSSSYILKNLFESLLYSGILFVLILIITTLMSNSIKKVQEQEEKQALEAIKEQQKENNRIKQEELRKRIKQLELNKTSDEKKDLSSIDNETILSKSQLNNNAQSDNHDLNENTKDNVTTQFKSDYNQTDNFNI